MNDRFYFPLTLLLFGAAWIGAVFGAHTGYIATDFWTCAQHSAPGCFILAAGIERLFST